MDAALGFLSPGVVAGGRWTAGRRVVYKNTTVCVAQQIATRTTGQYASTDASAARNAIRSVRIVSTENAREGEAGKSTVLTPTRREETESGSEHSDSVSGSADEMLESIRQRQANVRTSSAADDDDDDDDDEYYDEDEDEDNLDDYDAELRMRARRRRRKKKNAARDSVRSYLQEIGRHKLLKAEHEIELARSIQILLKFERARSEFVEQVGREPSEPEWAEECGFSFEDFKRLLHQGQVAKEKMVAANLRLVVSIAKKYMNRGLSFQDLIQEGSIGLIKGTEKFDADKGFKFSTYATWWIRQAITRAIADFSRPIRLPVHINDTITALKKITKNLEAERGRPPTEAEIAEGMKVSVEKLRFIIRCSRTTLSLETPVGGPNDKESTTVANFIEWQGETPEEQTEKSLLREDINTVLNTLSSRERDVIRMRFGLDDGNAKTLEEIGAHFSVTRERIRQIESKALRKLRNPTRNTALREYVYES
mmetsp:Transcript_1010/g.3155  ORF Transcript_1010/g.3155 Transcript_1010/m.3155 type:complete len:482 (+) Transcript_1010:125-1570(+)